MPIQYTGVKSEHYHVRNHVGVFDVSHMGQLFLKGGDELTNDLQKIFPIDLAKISINQSKYSFLMKENGGIYDDLIITKLKDGYMIILNAACKEADLNILKSKIGEKYQINLSDNLSLIAIQGPKAKDVLDSIVPGVTKLKFMNGNQFKYNDLDIYITRSGYTGEDGFEISVLAESAEGLARTLLADERVEMSGLGARDTLRLEAGLCLYGQDIDETTTPVEAGLNWTIRKRRQEEGGFPGAEVIIRQIAEGPTRKLVGIRPDGRAPARTGTAISTVDGEPLGKVTSGAFGPTVGGPIAMGYVAAGFSNAGTPVQLEIRGKAVPATVTALPFTPRRYFKH